jgi:hypothetical protein
VNCVIVPNSLRDEINERIVIALGGRPIDDAEREHVFSVLLAYFNEHGVLPDFNLTEATP